AGIPAAIKDNIVTSGVPTTASRRLLEEFTDPLYDATVVEKLQAAQDVSMGKENLDEFTIGSYTETSAFKKTTNPWNKEYVPGGSSGGSAASVASGEVMFSLGSDTGGSIRQPASFTGLVGMKPTYGLVSRYGVVAFASSLDQVGPLTRTVDDNARVLEVIAGKDERDATSQNAAVPNYREALKEDVRGLNIAVPKQILGEGGSSDVRGSVVNALQMFELVGASWEAVNLPQFAYADAVYSVISSGEAASSLARYDGVRYGHRSDEATAMIDMY